MTQDKQQGQGLSGAPTQRTRRWIPLLSGAGAVALAAAVWAGQVAVQTALPSAAAERPASSDAVATPTGAATEIAKTAPQPDAAGVPAQVLARGPVKESTAPRTPPSSTAHDAHSAPVPSPAAQPGRAAGKPVGEPAAGIPVGEPAAGKPVGELPARATKPGTSPEKSLAAASSEAPVAAAGSLPPAAKVGADRSAGLVPRGPIDPKEVSRGSQPALGGCLREYGKSGQCVPVIPPSMAAHALQMTESGLDPLTMDHPWSCTEMRQTFPDGLAVRQDGVDPQGLDTNDDGTACGPAD